MLRVVSLRKVGSEDPQEYELLLKDLDDKDAVHISQSNYGSEPQLRAKLKHCGMPDAEINKWFEKAGGRPSIR